MTVSVRDASITDINAFLWVVGVLCRFLREPLANLVRGAARLFLARRSDTSTRAPFSFSLLSFMCIYGGTVGPAVVSAFIYSGSPPAVSVSHVSLRDRSPFFFSLRVCPLLSSFQDAFDQHVYMERWERLPGGRGPFFAIRRRPLR